MQKEDSLTQKFECREHTKHNQAHSFEELQTLPVQLNIAMINLCCRVTQSLEMSER